MSNALPNITKMDAREDFKLLTTSENDGWPVRKVISSKIRIPSSEALDRNSYDALLPKESSDEINATLFHPNRNLHKSARIFP